jgi:hypothetical protein
MHLSMAVDTINYCIRFQRPHSRQQMLRLKHSAFRSRYHKSGWLPEVRFQAPDAATKNSSACLDEESDFRIIALARSLRNKFLAREEAHVD